MKSRRALAVLGLVMLLLIGAVGCGRPFLEALGFNGETHNTGGAGGSVRLEVLPQTLLDGATAQIVLAQLPQAQGGLSVEVNAQAAHGLKALYATLHFDAARWRVGGVEWTDTLAGSESRLALAVAPAAEADGQPGMLTLGCVVAHWDQQPGFDGSGVLCRVLLYPAGQPGARAAGAGPAGCARAVSAAPSSPAAAPELSYNAGTQELSWYYAFPGDYDQNGEAAITDITPIGQHYHAPNPNGAGTPYPVDSLLRQVDGDNNGEINGADLVPLAQHIGRRLSQYNLYRSISQADYPATRTSPDQTTAADTVLLAAALGAPASTHLHFAATLAAPLIAGENVWVRPVDSAAPASPPGSPSPSYPAGWTAGAANTPPVAHDQTVSTPVGVARSLALGATDADGDSLAYAIVAPPQHGTLDSNSLPSTTYTPDGGFSGIDSFTFTASDGQSVSNTATVTLSVSGTPQLRAFPGAEGFGALATGGRGGQVVYVTNLDTSGPGSLQAALDVDGPKYILFKVSGVINGHVEMSRGDVTVAGQTSPGGIIVRGWICDPDPYLEDDAAGLLHHPENFILRHIRSRPDFDNAGVGGDPSDDGLRLHHAVNGIVDHFSVENAADEAIQISWTRDVTVQNTLLAETLGDHAYLGGMLVNYSNPVDGWPLTRLSVHHNCWNRIMGRMPELSRESPNAAGSVMELELSNNLLWDPGIGIQVAAGRGQLDNAPVYYALNWVGNRAIGRPSFPEPTAQAPGWTFGMMSPDFLQLDPNQTTTFFSDNVNAAFPAYPDYQQLYCCNDYDQQVANDPGGLPFPTNSNPGAFARTTRHAFPEISYTPGALLGAYMTANVGAFPRDPMDRRLMQAVQDGAVDPARRDVKHLPDDTYSLDFPAGNPPAPPQDSDNDGMPDAWETAHGLNPSLQDHNGTSLSLAETGVEGYTNLEVYLNQLADSITHP
jgi:hypothetical protein